MNTKDMAIIGGIGLLAYMLTRTKPIPAVSEVAGASVSPLPTPIFDFSFLADIFKNIPPPTSTPIFPDWNPPDFPETAVPDWIKTAPEWLKTLPTPPSGGGGIPDWLKTAPDWFKSSPTSGAEDKLGNLIDKATELIEDAEMPKIVELPTVKIPKPSISNLFGGVINLPFTRFIGEKFIDLMLGWNPFTAVLYTAKTSTIFPTETSESQGKPEQLYKSPKSEVEYTLEEIEALP